MFWTCDCCFENLDIFITGDNTVAARDEGRGGEGEGRGLWSQKCCKRRSYGLWICGWILQEVKNMEWCLVIFGPIGYYRVDVELQIIIDIQTFPI